MHNPKNFLKPSTSVFFDRDGLNVNLTWRLELISEWDVSRTAGVKLVKLNSLTFDLTLRVVKILFFFYRKSRVRSNAITAMGNCERVQNHLSWVEKQIMVKRISYYKYRYVLCCWFFVNHIITFGVIRIEKKKWIL